MHFRIRGNSVQLVKTQPGEGDGKAVSKPVGSANLKTGEIKTKGSDSLTAEETAEVKAWMTRHRGLLEQKREVEYRLFGETLAGLASWIATADAKLIAEHDDEIRSGLQQVRRALDRAKGGEGAGRKPGSKRGEKRKAKAD